MSIFLYVGSAVPVPWFTKYQQSTRQSPSKPSMVTCLVLRVSRPPSSRTYLLVKKPLTSLRDYGAITGQKVSLILTMGEILGDMVLGFSLFGKGPNPELSKSCLNEPLVRISQEVRVIWRPNRFEMGSKKIYNELKILFFFRNIFREVFLFLFILNRTRYTVFLSEL